MVPGKEQQQLKTNKGMTTTSTKIKNQKKHEDVAFRLIILSIPKPFIILSGALRSDLIFKIPPPSLCIRAHLRGPRLIPKDQSHCTLVCARGHVRRVGMCGRRSIPLDSELTNGFHITDILIALSH